MKLAAKYNRATLPATIAVFFLSGICYYFIIHFILITQLDKDLKVEQEEILDYVHQNRALPDPTDYKDQQISIRETGAQKVTYDISSVDTFSKDANENISARRMVMPLTLDGKNYEVVILKSKEETEDLIQLVLFTTLGVISLLVLVLLVLNRLLFKRLWLPFRSTLGSMKAFNLSGGTSIELPDTNITEFKELNEAVKVMTERVNQEYHALKSFADNASHEMQTPLAIIRSKADLLIQQSTEEQHIHLETIYNATNRLARLNHALLLISKLENRQFASGETCNLKPILQSRLEQLQEFINDKQLTITLQLSDTPVKINKELADILMNNLVSNAIRHNIPHGTINALLTSQKFEISNSGPPMDIPEQQLFKRFSKGSASDGTGLGLAIVDQICINCGFSLSYDYLDSKHRFIIQF